MNYYAAVHAFLLTSELGSFSVAARRLSIKASTVSHYISTLEGELGGALFNRSTRGVVLTERGATFKRLVQGAVEKLDEARAAASLFRHTRADAAFHDRQRN